MTDKRSIIVEGADASGKSTLATELGEHFGIYTFRAGPKPVDREHAEVCMIYQTAWLSKTSCVWDRFTGISNTLNMPSLEESDVPVHAYYTKLAIQSAVVVICTAENMEEHIPAMYETDADVSKMMRENQQVRDNYVRMAHDLPGVITYDFKVRSLDSLIREISNEISINI